MRPAGRAPLKATIERAIRILQFVASRHFGASMNELAAECGCSRRQIYRYMKSLEEAGVRLVKVYIHGGKVRWKIVEQQEFFRKIGIL